MQVSGKEIDQSDVVDKCASAYKAVAKKKAVDLSNTGDKKTNLMLNFLTCQAKKGSGDCAHTFKEYEKCHRAFMGVGSYNGERHCGGPMKDLYECVVGSTN